MVDEPRYRPLAWAVSLPFIVAAVWVALVLLAQHHRGVLVAELSDIAAHGNTAEAAFAVRQLSAMPNPPVDLLVAAATSPTRGVAVEAQLAINNLVRHWYRDVKSGNRQQHVANQLMALVDALSRQQAAFSIADYPWLGRITRRILRLANHFPPEMTLPLAPQCEVILADVEATDASIVAFTEAATLAVPDEHIAAALAASTPAAVGDGRVPRPFAPRTNSLGALGDEAAATSEVRLPDDVRSDVAFALPQTESNTPLDTNQFVAAVPPSPAGQRPAATDDIVAMNDAAPHPAYESYGWRPRWSQRTDESVPTVQSPLAAMGGNPSAVMSAPTPVSIAPAETTSVGTDPYGRLTSLETRSLLARWLDADATSALELERELAGRGFGRLPAALVEQLLSPESDARCALVTDLLAQPGVDARPWLVLLSDDEEADVRLAAVTVMATSNDPQLIEQAWQVVLHDRDPRIANLAPRLRARQSGRQQR